MRGFNEKLFGDKLVAGQLPTQLGLIGSQEVFDTDVDAIAFFDRVTAAGGILSNTEKTAIDTLVKQMKADGTWTPMKAIYPMVGASAAACAQNLKSSSFTGTFTSGWTFASTGVTGNGTSAYMQTNFNPNNQSSVGANDMHISSYTRTNKAGSPQTLIGAFYGANDTELTPYFSDNNFYSIINDTVYTNISYANNNSQGFYVTNKNNTNNNLGYKNGTLVINGTNISASKTNANIVVGARTSGGSVDRFATYEIQFSSIGNGLTNTQASNFYTAVQAFQTTLSRQV
jgi:hypothetical protein